MPTFRFLGAANFKASTRSRVRLIVAFRLAESPLSLDPVSVLQPLFISRTYSDSPKEIFRDLKKIVIWVESSEKQARLSSYL